MVYHLPVLASACITGLAIKPDGLYVDGTLGGGGHSELILRELGPKGHCVGFDVDPDAHAFAARRLDSFGSRFIPVRANFSRIPESLYRLGIEAADGILLDLGVSSRQLDNPDKGFTFRSEAPLDLRLDPDRPITAAGVVNTYPEEKLIRIFREYGEEEFARLIARELIRTRQQTPLKTTSDLTACIDRVIFADKRKKTYARIFQALRIEVNEELAVLKAVLEKSLSVLKPGGRLVVISYHSLEDRLVKEFIREEAKTCICPPGMPVCTCGKTARLKLISRKAIQPSKEEIEVNPRARSARLRIAERI